MSTSSQTINLKQFKNYAIYLFKELVALLFYITGHIWVLKKIFSNKKLFVILNYHNFSIYNKWSHCKGSVFETGHAKQFEKQIRFLNKYLRFSYPSEFFGGKVENGISILLTFDDGYKDNYQIAFPILKKYHAKAIFFIVTDYIGTRKMLWHDKVRYLARIKSIQQDYSESVLRKMNEGEGVPDDFIKLIEERETKIPVVDRSMMNWGEVKKIHEADYKIGAHTANHKILSYLNYQQQNNEITQSVKKIDSKLDIKCDLFAFPNGLFNDATIRILKENQIEYGFSTISGHNTKNTEKLKLRRIGVNPSDSVPLLLLKIYKNCLL